MPLVYVNAHDCLRADSNSSFETEYSQLRVDRRDVRHRAMQKHGSLEGFISRRTELLLQFVL